jgi:hypothetical protein
MRELERVLKKVRQARLQEFAIGSNHERTFNWALTPSAPATCPTFSSARHRSRASATSPLSVTQPCCTPTWMVSPNSLKALRHAHATTSSASWLLFRVTGVDGLPVAIGVGADCFIEDVLSELHGAINRVDGT